MDKKLANAYNIHKRKTIERITKKNTMALYRVIASFVEENSNSIISTLDDGRKPRIDNRELRKKVASIVDGHIDSSIEIGIADGLQEVAGDQKLNAFVNFPLTIPIERTLTLAQEKDKKKIFKKVSSSLADDKKQSVFTISKSFTKMQVSVITRAYQEIAKDWLAGESTIKEVKAKIQESLSKTQVQAERIFRTETTRWFNKSRAEYFSTETDVDYYMIFAITDGRISKICETRHGFVFENTPANLRKYAPPFHPNCRTVLVPLISKLKRDLRVIEGGKSISPSRFYPLPKNWAA